MQGPLHAYEKKPDERRQPFSKTKNVEKPKSDEDVKSMDFENDSILVPRRPSAWSFLEVQERFRDHAANLRDNHGWSISEADADERAEYCWKNHMERVELRRELAHENQPLFRLLPNEVEEQPWAHRGILRPSEEDHPLGEHFLAVPVLDSATLVDYLNQLCPLPQNARHSHNFYLEASMHCPSHAPKYRDVSQTCPTLLKRRTHYLRACIGRAVARGKADNEKDPLSEAKHLVFGEILRAEKRAGVPWTLAELEVYFKIAFNTIRGRADVWASERKKAREWWFGKTDAELRAMNRVLPKDGEEAAALYWELHMGVVPEFAEPTFEGNHGRGVRRRSQQQLVEEVERKILQTQININKALRENDAIYEGLFDPAIWEDHLPTYNTGQPGSIYFESQSIGWECAKHAANMLAQGPLFSSDDFSAAGRQLQARALAELGQEQAAEQAP